MIGKIKFYNEKEDYGYIAGDNGIDYRFTISSYQSDHIPVGGLDVEFNPGNNNRGRIALKINPIGKSQRSNSLALALSKSGLVLDKDQAISALEEISSWKTEAKLEDIERYYYPTQDLNLITNGSRCYIIGRKGSGKTAMCEYIVEKKGYNKFATKLTFKNFPFNDLYKYNHDRFTYPNQYITFWKYMIYVGVARMMIDNERIDSKYRKIFKDAFYVDPEVSLLSSIDHVTSRSFSISISELKGEWGSDYAPYTMAEDWTAKVEILERILVECVDESSYFICFDELDEDYKNVRDTNLREDYIALITGLIKAVQDVKSKFKYSNQRIYPLVFLRNDIYEQLSDPDRSKWMDLTRVIEWDESSLRVMVGHRLSRSIRGDAAAEHFNVVWPKLVQGLFMKGESGQTMFDYMIDRTHMRPRDIVRYLRIVAGNTLSKSLYNIVPKAIRDSEKEYSIGFRSELVDEINGLLDNSNRAFDALSLHGRPKFAFGDFHSKYSSYEPDADDNNSIMALEKMFRFSAIGSVNTGKNVFVYEHPNAPFHWKSEFIVHRGLYKSMQF